MEIKGIGKDAEVVINEQGGKQSKCVGRADLLPALSLIAVSKVLDDGATRYGVNNWRKIDAQSHLNHALLHILALLAGDTQDDHWGHAACRILMAHDQHLIEEATQQVLKPELTRCSRVDECLAPVANCNPTECPRYTPERSL